MKNTKGFTLIELLAVIVILAVIALIATPMVLDSINQAKEGALQSSAYSVINAVENKLATDLIKNPSAPMPTSVKSMEGVKIKGTAPTSIDLTIDANGSVTTGTIVFEDGKATVTNGKVTVSMGKTASASASESASAE